MSGKKEIVEGKKVLGEKGNGWICRELRGKEKRGGNEKKKEILGEKRDEGIKREKRMGGMI